MYSHDDLTLSLWNHLIFIWIFYKCHHQIFLKAHLINESSIEEKRDVNVNFLHDIDWFLSRVIFNVIFRDCEFCLLQWLIHLSNEWTWANLDNSFHKFLLDIFLFKINLCADLKWVCNHSFTNDWHSDEFRRASFGV